MSNPIGFAMKNKNCKITAVLRQEQVKNKKTICDC